MPRSERRESSPPPPYAGPEATSARVVRDQLIVGLRDGRTLMVPLQLIPGFLSLPRRALSVCEVVGGGIAIYFPALDEHVGVENLLHPEHTRIPKILPRVVNPHAIPMRRRRAHA